MNKYFYGKQLTEEEIKKNRISYQTLAACFDMVLCNNIIKVDKNLFDNVVSGSLYQYDIDQAHTDYEAWLEEQCLNCFDFGEELDSMLYVPDFEDWFEGCKEEYEQHLEIFQYYIVSDNAKDLLEEGGELVLYSPILDCYIWCICHYGTAWNYLYTDIKIDKEVK